MSVTSSLTILPPCPQCGREDPWYHKAGRMSENFCVHCGFAPTEDAPPVHASFPAHCPKCEAEHPWRWQTGPLSENFCVHCGHAPREDTLPVQDVFPAHCPQCQTPDSWRWKIGKLWENWCTQCGFAPPIPAEEIPAPDPIVPDRPKPRRKSWFTSLGAFDDDSSAAHDNSVSLFSTNDSMQSGCVICGACTCSGIYCITHSSDLFPSLSSSSMFDDSWTSRSMFDDSWASSSMFDDSSSSSLFSDSWSSRSMFDD